MLFFTFFLADKQINTRNTNTDNTKVTRFLLQEENIFYPCTTYKYYTSYYKKRHENEKQ